jgi:hypothetical protein
MKQVTAGPYVISRKLITAVVSNLLIFAIGMLTLKLGLTLDASTAAQISEAAGLVAASVAGFFIREDPAVAGVPEAILVNEQTPQE